METGRQIKNQKDFYDNQRQRRRQPELEPGMETKGQECFGGTESNIWGLVGCVGYERGRNEKRPIG